MANKTEKGWQAALTVVLTSAILLAIAGGAAPWVILREADLLCNVQSIWLSSSNDCCSYNCYSAMNRDYDCSQCKYEFVWPGNMCSTSAQTTSRSTCTPTSAIYSGTFALIVAIIALTAVNWGCIVPSLLSTAPGNDDLPHCCCRDRRGRASPCWLLAFLTTTAAAVLLGFITVEIGTKLSNPEQFWPGVRGRGFWAISTPGYYLLAMATAAAALTVLLLFIWARSGDNSEQHAAAHGESDTNERSTLLAMRERGAAQPSRL